MMNKLLSLLLVALLLASVIAPAALAGVPTSYIKLPEGSTSINLRASGSTSAAKRGVVKNGQQVDLLKIGATWSRVRVIKTGATGYIKNGYVAHLAESGNSRGIAKAYRVKAGDTVYLHNAPHATADRITALKSDTKLKLWEEKSGWAYITTLSGMTGWVDAAYLTEGFTQVTTTKVHFRHGENGQTITSLKKGTAVNVISIDGSWTEVSYDGTIGDIYTKYLK